MSVVGKTRRGGVARGLSAHASRCVFALVTILVTAACAPARDPLNDALADYIERLERVLQVAAEPARMLPVLAVAPKFPPTAAVHVDIQPVSISVLDFLSLHRCDVGGLIGMRNSPLGRTQVASERWFYERQLLQGLRACADDLGADAPEPLRLALADKSAAIAQAHWNAVVGGPEFAGWFARSVPADVAVSMQSVRAVLQLADAATTEDDLLTAFHTLHLDAGGAAAVFAGAASAIDNLRAATDVIHRRLNNKAVCLQGRPTPTAKTLHNVFTGRYGRVIQPQLVVLDRSLARIEGATSQAIALLPAADQPKAIASWWSTVQGQSSSRLLRAALADHVAVWQRVLDQCGMLPGRA